MVRPLPLATFEAMEQSLAKETVDMPPDIGVSVSLWKLEALMEGYRKYIDSQVTHD